jgi:hypothetical protein
VITAPEVPAPVPPPPPVEPTPSAPVHVAEIRLPANVQQVLQLRAKGVQVFRCERIGTANYEWRFQRPQARLFDSKGKAVATHGAHFSFKHSDGSRLAARIIAYEDEPNATDLRPVLMAATASGKGAFAQVTHVRRIETHGGLPPASCKPTEANRILSVPFSADFIFYRPKPR